MYNDYYLEQINNKLNTTNNKLEELLTNQYTLISGDIEIENRIKENNNIGTMLVMVFSIYLIMYFVVRSLK